MLAHRNRGSSLGPEEGVTHPTGVAQEALAGRDPKRNGTTYLLLLAVLVAVAAMTVGVAWEEWRAGGGGGGGAPAGVGVAGQSVAWRVLWRLADPTWLRFPMVGVVA